jgi:[acyl-carrier-protein] S-malonyltransferase
VSIAAYNAPQQVVIAGDSVGLERAITSLKKRGARRVVPLRVSGAFHTKAMAAVQEEWQAVVEAAPLQTPRIPVIANATANIVSSVEALRQELKIQMTSPVRWAATTDILLRRNFDHILEFGPGAALTKMIAGIANADIPVSIDSYHAALDAVGASTDASSSEG